MPIGLFSNKGTHNNNNIDVNLAQIKICYYVGCLDNSSLHKDLNMYMLEVGEYMFCFHSCCYMLSSLIVVYHLCCNMYAKDLTITQKL